MSVRFPVEDIHHLLGSFLQISEPGDDGVSHVVVWRLMPDGDLAAVAFAIAYLDGAGRDVSPSLVFTSALKKAVAEFGDGLYLAAVFVECYQRDNPRPSPFGPLRRRAHPLLGTSEFANLADYSAGFVTDERVKGQPGAVEAVLMYAADTDGRRYRATRYLTGPHKDMVDGIWTAEPGEAFSEIVDRSAPIGAEIRKAAGISIGALWGAE